MLIYLLYLETNTLSSAKISNNIVW